MVEPKIVFCKNNHIYDSAINTECPYCLNIAREQKELSRLVSEQGTNNIEMDVDEYEDEATELIYHSDRRQHVDDEVTELINRTDVAGNLDEDDYESTELIDYSVKPRRAYLVGWLVSIDGEQKGHSIEVVEGQNYLYQKQEMVVLKTDGFETERKLGVIYQDRSNKEFYIRPEAEVLCQINNAVVVGLHILRPYDSISLQGNKFIFVNLDSKYFEWGM